MRWTKKDYLQLAGLGVPIVIVGASSLLISFRVGFHVRTSFLLLYLDTIQAAIVSGGADLLAVILSFGGLASAIFFFQKSRRNGLTVSVLKSSHFWIGVGSLAVMPLLVFLPNRHFQEDLKHQIVFTLAWATPIVLSVADGLSSRKIGPSKIVMMASLLFLYGCLICYELGRFSVEWRAHISSPATIRTKKNQELKGAIFYLSENMVILCEPNKECNVLFKDIIESISIGN